MGSGGSSGHQNHTVAPGGAPSPTATTDAPDWHELLRGGAEINWSEEDAAAIITRPNPLQHWRIEPMTPSEWDYWQNECDGALDSSNLGETYAEMLQGRQIILQAGTRLPEGLSRQGQRQAASAEAAAGAAETLEARAAQYSAMRDWPDADVSYLEDARAYENAFHAARERMDRGEPAVPYMTENACGGMANPEDGRGFGVELEFDLPDVPRHERGERLLRIADEMHAAGVTQSSRVFGYHEGRGRDQTNYTADPNGWRVEMDGTVAGEVVSPILHDTPETWRNLKTVCDIIARNGGRASVRTGSHVHVSTPDYDHNVENYNRLLANAQSFEDTIFRLSANPQTQTHRGMSWCRPQDLPPRGWESQSQAVGYNTGHNYAINMQGMRTGGARDHAEFRTYDGSLDPGAIQAQVNISLGMTHAAIRGASAMDPPHNQPRHEEYGTHRAIYGRRQSRNREQWRQASASVRSMADLIFWKRENKEQLAALMATTSWQGRRQQTSP